MSAAYELFYWPTIQGRGEFVRLALEQSHVAYIDVARAAGEKGEALLQHWLENRALSRPPFVPPFLKAGKLIIAQTANILLFLGARHRIAPADEAGRLWTHQLQLTVADFVAEIHDTHHPLASGLYYEEQKSAARKRAQDLRTHRMPKFLGYFEQVLKRNLRGKYYLVAKRPSYVDLSVFQVIAGLHYAFPNAMRSFKRTYPLLDALNDRVTALPRIASYLSSPRRIAFNQEGIFRHYPELDQAPRHKSRRTR